MHSINESYKVLQLSAPSAKTATGQSTGVDVEAYLDDVIVVVNMGAVTGTTPTMTLAVETSDAVSGTYVAVATFGGFTDADANTVFSIGVNLDGQNSTPDDQKFIRLNYTIGGTTPSFTFGAVALVRAETGKSGLNSDNN